MPTDQEIFGFFRVRSWTCDMLSAMFREPKEHAVYVMFLTEELMKTELLKCPPSAIFTYEDHQETTVTFATARGNLKYVRVFGLPIEVDDKHVAAVISKYGKIQNIVRERYGADTGYPIMNGVRGIHIEMENEIPLQIHIQHFQAKVFYDGMSSKCFVCGSTDHVKANCPKRVSVHTRLNQNGGTSTYAGIVANGAKRDVFRFPTEISKESSVGNEVPLETEEVCGSQDVPPTAEKEQHKDLMEIDEVKSKKRGRKQYKDTANAGQRSNSATTDSDNTSASKVKINASGNDLIEMQVTRSRSKQSAK